MNETLQNATARPRRGIPNWLTAVLLAGALLVFFSASGTGSPPPGWGSDPAVAFEEAAASGKKVVMGFYLPGCPPCAAMEHEVLPARSVRAALDGFVPVLVNAISFPDFAERYEVESTPTYIIVDAAGEVLARRTGFQDAGEFVQFVGSATR